MHVASLFMQINNPGVACQIKIVLYLSCFSDTVSSMKNENNQNEFKTELNDTIVCRWCGKPIPQKYVDLGYVTCSRKCHDLLKRDMRWFRGVNTSEKKQCDVRLPLDEKFKRFRGQSAFSSQKHLDDNQ